jgi:ElaB/YqjD/DUF883 family membrane-anchored ribosome-binding protein
MANAQTAKRMSNSHVKADVAEMAENDPIEMGRDMVEYLREYVRENPETSALWCLGIGFVLGWKLKIW